MHNINKIRENPKAFSEGWKRRGLNINIDEILSIDKELRQNITKIQELQQKRNSLSEEAGKAKSQNDEKTFSKLNKEAQDIKKSISDVEDIKSKISNKLNDFLSSLPNLPADDLPVGTDESSNIELKKLGKIVVTDNIPHYEIAENLEGLDLETAAELSGSRFAITSGSIAKLERALSYFMLDIHVNEHGYQEINVPY